MDATSLINAYSIKMWAASVILANELDIYEGDGEGEIMMRGAKLVQLEALI